ncbi:MAG TPA: LysE family translocator [Acidimicrobiales bacterium]|nr:LysE family translocator [Acidimicrobiales bacterium]
MISAGAGAGMAVVALGLVLTPGPNMLYLVSRSITQGRRAGLVSLLGVGAGFVVYLAAAVAGIATVFSEVPAAYTALRLAGAGYLLWLAWKTLRPAGGSIFTPEPLPPGGPSTPFSGPLGPGRLFAMGFVTNLLNPKIAVLYVSLLPQFIDPHRGSVALQSLALGAIQATIAVTGNGVIVLTAGTIAVFLARRPGWLRAQRYFMGTVLGALAVRLLTDRARTAPAG